MLYLNYKSNFLDCGLNKIYPYYSMFIYSLYKLLKYKSLNSTVNTFYTLFVLSSHTPKGVGFAHYSVTYKTLSSSIY
ncbi:hypothetical protein BN1097_710070 [Clostridioides difficile]|uniref:Uncharacterized protein n=1 Tax=Clostridioides difficile TaxID=1496 RepID=A0A069AIX9_CLODI|nr:hypothetical protein BN1097_710070 [Clostridioides difficile]